MSVQTAKLAPVEVNILNRHLHMLDAMSDAALDLIKAIERQKDSLRHDPNGLLSDGAAIEPIKKMLDICQGYLSYIGEI